MAVDLMDVADGTAAAFGIGVLYQAIEDRVPSAKVDLFTGGTALAGYGAGLMLMHQARGRGGSQFKVGEGLAYGAAALGGAQATRYVDGKYLKLTIPAGFAANTPRPVTRAPQTVAPRAVPSGGGRPPEDF